jgi:asparagine synthase (glutamine-hydrolysing)
MPGDANTPELPRLTLAWSVGTADARLGDAGFPTGPGLTVGHRGYRPQPFVHEGARAWACVVGSPVLDERVDLAGVAAALADTHDVAGLARRLNGQFLLVRLDHGTHTLTVANDRFASVPFHYVFRDGQLLASALFADLFRELGARGWRSLRPDVAFEYVWLQRVVGSRTLDDGASYLLPASVLEVSDAGARTSRYWRPDFTKDRASLDDHATELAEGIARSIRRKTSDGPHRWGLFLSGGLDSRSVLAAFEDDLTCFTVAFSDNYEVACARRSALATGARHRYLELPDDHFVRHTDTMGELTGGMFTLDHALFLGLADDVAADADVVFHGHGFDYLFQGMYLPTRAMRIAGRSTFVVHHEPVAGDVAEQFLRAFPPRLKGVDLLELCRPEVRADTYAALRSAVGDVLAEGADVCQTDDDRWEYMVVHALSRHYSHPNVVSKQSTAEQRTASFDNDLFNLYFRLPAEHRLAAAVLRRALAKRSKRLARIPSANLAMPIGLGPWGRTAWLIGRKGLRHATGIARLRESRPEDRTWPDRDTYLATHPAYQDLVRRAVASERLEQVLPMLDWPRVRAQAEGWISRPAGHAPFLLSLLTLDRFLEATA